MESFIVGIITGGLLVFMLFNWVVSRLLKRLASQETAESSKLLTRLEEHNGVFYLYRYDTDEFLAQGSSKKEVQQRVNEKFKNSPVDVYVFFSGEPDTLKKFNHENRHSQ
jgi:hypothetical protein